MMIDRVALALESMRSWQARAEKAEADYDRGLDDTINHALTQRQRMVKMSPNEMEAIASEKWKSSVQARRLISLNNWAIEYATMYAMIAQAEMMAEVRDGR